MRQVFCQLLLHYSQVEMESEQLRQELCMFDEFHPYILFKHIDQMSKQNGSITIEDLYLFLQNSTYPHCIEDCRHFIEFFDQANKDCIYYSEFLRFILPANNPELRQLITLKTPSLILSLKIKELFTELVHFEISMFKKANQYIEMLEEDSCYNFKNLFRQLDKYQHNRITQQDIKEFFKLSQVSVLQGELDAIFRRLDLLNDGVIDSFELQRICIKRLGPHNTLQTPQKEMSMKKSENTTPINKIQQFYQSDYKIRDSATKQQRSITFSDLKNDQIKTEKKEYKKSVEKPQKAFITPSKERLTQSRTTQQKSYLKASLKKRGTSQEKVLNNSTMNVYSESPKKYLEQKQALRGELEMHNLRCKTASSKKALSKEKQKVKVAGKQKQKITSASKVIQTKSIGQTFCDLLIEFMMKLTKIEQLKICLVCEPEFNLCDAFSFLDTKKKGHLCIEDLNQYLPKHQLTNIFKNGTITFQQFIKLMEPQSKDYSILLRKKEPLNLKEPLKRCINTFCELIDQINSLQTFMTQMKQKINKLSSLQNYFRLLDQNQDQCISLKDIDQFLYSFRVEPELKDLELLHDMLDADRDAKITFSDFQSIFSL